MEKEPRWEEGKCEAPERLLPPQNNECRHRRKGERQAPVSCPCSFTGEELGPQQGQKPAGGRVREPSPPGKMTPMSPFLQEQTESPGLIWRATLQGGKSFSRHQTFKNLKARMLSSLQSNMFSVFAYRSLTGGSPFT